jgi:hypothetical protein
VCDKSLALLAPVPDRYQLVWRHLNTALTLLHRIRLWTHRLWIEAIQLSPAEVAAAAALTTEQTQAANRARLDNAIEAFTFYYTGPLHTLDAPSCSRIVNRERFIDVYRQLLNYCRRCAQNKCPRPSFEEFMRRVVCALVCSECVCVAPVRVRAAVHSFGPVTTSAESASPHDERILGLAALWRGREHERFYPRASAVELPDIRQYDSMFPHHHVTQANIWNATLANLADTQLCVPCSGEPGKCFAHFVANCAPEPTLTWEQLVDDGLQHYYNNTGRVHLGNGSVVAAAAAPNPKPKPKPAAPKLTPSAPSLEILEE